MNKNIYYGPTFKQEKQGKYMLYLFDEIYKKNGELYDNEVFRSMSGMMRKKHIHLAILKEELKKSPG